MAQAIGTDIISRIVGYLLQKADFRTSSPNLPQRYAILGEANHTNQSGLSLLPQQITSAKQAGDLFGYGSPIYHEARILFPISNDGVGGIPVYVYPQIEAVGAAAKVVKVTPSGMASQNGTHYVTVAGRNSIDGNTYAINILEGDTVAIVAQKISDAVNNILASPATGSHTSYDASLTAKWRGLTSNEMSVTIDTGTNTLGLSYVVSVVAAGSGTPDISGALNQFGSAWTTGVINTYGTVSTILDNLEAFNGIPDPENPTGRYAPTVFKPFIALTGSIADDPSSITDTRDGDVTIAICPAPLSAGFSFEAAANMAYLFAIQCQNSPALDVAGQFYPDMPTPLSIGSMASFINRNAIVTKGCSTVDLVAGRYCVQDFVTTYHPDGENPPAYRWCRNLNIDFNSRYTYLIQEAINVLGKVIANDSDQVGIQEVVKPKMWKQVLNAEVFTDLVKRGLWVEADFSSDSLIVNISSTNPDRFETQFRYKRSGFARQSATIAQAGFNYGTATN